jgi:alkylated DNA repair dioxygenase AlkB
MHDKFPNIINHDGQVIYFGSILKSEDKVKFFNELLHKIEWKNEVVIMFGKEITTKRKVAFYADAGMEYTYSNKTKKGHLWNDTLLKIKQAVEHYTEASYNACLLNLYHNGNEGMGWHSDDEKEILLNSSIASLSLGAERKFSFKHKTTKEHISILLENGSLLEMKGTIQKNWVHAMPKTSKVITPRINLTFRQMNFLKN